MKKNITKTIITITPVKVNDKTRILSSQIDKIRQKTNFNDDQIEAILNSYMEYYKIS
jgi:hypothetical protein